jgi:hypothetical protein
MMAGFAADQDISARIVFPDWDRHAFLPSLTREALRIYLATRDFTALHLITSLHALRVISASMPIGSGIRDAYWYAFCLARLTIPARARLPPGKGLPAAADWDAIAALAVASDDDHVVKLVYSCREESRAYGYPAYLDAARLARGAVRDVP